MVTIYRGGGRGEEVLCISPKETFSRMWNFVILVYRIPAAGIL